MRRLVTLLAIWAASSTSAAGDHARLSDPFFGEALFYARQGDYFSAIQRLDAELDQYHALDEPQLDTLYFHVGEAEFSVGDFELNYRMHHRAGRAIRAVLEGNVPESVRNEAAYRLARIHFQKGQMQHALQALDRMTGRMDDNIRDQASFLRANVYLAIGRPVDAIGILREPSDRKELRSFSGYNLAVALWRAGEEESALRQFEKAGTAIPASTSDRAITDKVNLVMGTLLLDEGRFEDAVPALQRVSLDGPFSNQALLSAGWAELSARRVERAVVPWNILAQRDPTQGAVQEALLALPYAYGKLALHGRAAVLYGQALASFDDELRKLDASMKSIRGGNFLQALIREEIRHDENWVVKLRELPQTPETYYLTQLMASHDFHTGLRNYLDLEDLRVRLETWRASFAAYDDLIEARLAYFEPILPGQDAAFRELDSRMRLRKQQQQLLERRLEDLLVNPRPQVLATAAERTAFNRLIQLRAALGDADDEQAQQSHTRIERLQGLITWQLHTNYHERLTDYHEHLAQLREAMQELDGTYAHYVRVRQIVPHGYSGYEQPFARLRERVDVALQTVNDLMQGQGELLESVAIAELERREQRLQDYLHQARFAMADSYDRATKTLQGAGQ